MIMTIFSFLHFETTINMGHVYLYLYEFMMKATLLVNKDMPFFCAFAIWITLHVRIGKL